MKKILTLMLAVSLWVSSFTFGAQAFGGRYVLDGLDEDYLIMLNSTDEDSQLGSLSAKYESSGNPGTVSGGGDYGGVSFGAYQFSSRFDVPMHIFNEMQHFFNVYKALEDKDTDAGGLQGREEAIKVINSAMDGYYRKFLKD